MAVKQPILRQDAQLFEIIFPDGRVIQVKMTREGYRFFEAILARLVAGGL